MPGTDHFVSGQGHYTQASLTCYQTAAEEWQPQKTGLHVPAAASAWSHPAVDMR